MIELVSDVGGGKTTFVRGLAEGMGSTDHVSSPSFTLTNQYKGKHLTIQHFDFYRLSEPGIMRDELAEMLEDSSTVVVVEWAGLVADVLPSNRFTIHITASGDTKRDFTVAYPKSMSYLLQEFVS